MRRVYPKAYSRNEKSNAKIPAAGSAAKEAEGSDPKAAGGTRGGLHDWQVVDLLCRREREVLKSTDQQLRANFDGNRIKIRKLQ